MLEQITPIVITFNESENIARTLDRLVWAKRIVIIDSGSTDETLKIARSYSQVEVFQRPFDDFASQCNYGISQVKTEWVLSLDADYELSAKLVSEISKLNPNSVDGYKASFVYKIYGRALRGTLYPARTVLYRKNKASYRNLGHGHCVVIDGTINTLTGTIYHDDHKTLGHWFSSQHRYARIEAEYLLTCDRQDLSYIDKIRLAAWPAPLLVFAYTLFFKGCVFDGWAGWYYALQRLLAETLIALEVIDRRLRRVSVV